MFEVAGNEEIPTLEADAFLLETGNIRSEEASSELSGSVDNDDLEDDVSWRDAPPAAIGVDMSCLRAVLAVVEVAEPDKEVYMRLINYRNDLDIRSYLRIPIVAQY